MITLLEISVVGLCVLGLLMLRDVVKGLSRNLAVRYEMYLLVLLGFGIQFVLFGLPPRSVVAQFIGVLCLLSLPVFLISFAYENGDVRVIKVVKK